MGKKWYLSKTFWAGVVAILVSAYNTAASHFGLPAIPEFIYGILGAFGIYGRTTATGPLTK